MRSITSSVAFAAAVFGSLAHADLFTLTASQPGGALNGKAINAAGGAFYIGLEGPATYCPTQVEPNCPVVKGTTFANSLEALWVSICLSSMFNSTIH
jgi:hypothetical protein